MEGKLTRPNILSDTTDSMQFSESPRGKRKQETASLQADTHGHTRTHSDTHTMCILEWTEVYREMVLHPRNFTFQQRSSQKATDVQDAESN